MNWEHAVKEIDHFKSVGWNCVILLGFNDAILKENLPASVLATKHCEIYVFAITKGAYTEFQKDYWYYGSWRFIE